VQPLAIRINSRVTPHGVVVELHGWLGQEVLGELENLCASIGGPFLLDLSQLAGTDEAGLRALRGRVAAGVRVEGASHYIQLLLEGED